MNDADVIEPVIVDSPDIVLPVGPIVTTCLATCAVLLRFLARWMKGLKYKTDDWMLLSSMPCLYILLGLLITMTYVGLGTPSVFLSPETLVKHKKALLAYECIYIITLLKVKASFLLMYVRAFDNHSMRVSCLVLGSMILTWSLAILFATIFQCTPVSKAWDNGQEGTCISLKSVLMGNAVPNIINDVAILIIPLRQVWKLVPTIQLRLQLLVVFSLGFLVVFASVFRFTTLFSFNPHDITYTLAPSNMWCNIECCCGVISVCLPTLGPLIQWIFQHKLFGYEEVSRVTSVTRIELQSRTSDYSKDELSPGTQPPWERIELEPYSHAVIALSIDG